MKYRERKGPIYIKENKRERDSYTFFGVPERREMGEHKFKEILAEHLSKVMKDIKDSGTPVI